MNRQPQDFFAVHPQHARPSATGGTAVAFVRSHEPTGSGHHLLRKSVAELANYDLFFVNDRRIHCAS
jgi:hypothetical protein